MDASTFFRVAGSTLIKEIKINISGIDYLFKIIGGVTKGVTLAWVVYISGTFSTLFYVALGAALFSVWSGVASFGGWALDNERYNGTLEYTLITRTPMPIVLFCKILASMLFEIPAGVVTTLVIFAMTGIAPVPQNFVFFILSLIIALAEISVIGFFMASLVVIVGGQSGFFMGIMPLGAILSGYLIPASKMPLALGLLARLMPGTWAMESLWLSINSASGILTMSAYLLISIIVSCAWFALAWYMSRLAEKRIRVTGTLSIQF